jgi:hypothetical protein
MDRLLSLGEPRPARCGVPAKRGIGFGTLANRLSSMRRNVNANCPVGSWVVRGFGVRVVGFVRPSTAR